MEHKTVFVIGAGASNEVGFPTGHELKNQISHLLDLKFDFGKLKSGDWVIVDALRNLVKNSDGSPGSIESYVKNAWHIRDALPQAISIDNFIDTHRENKEIAICGKLSIVRSILDAERNSKLFLDPNRDRNFDYRYLEDTWYIPFFQLLTENCERNDLEERLKSVVLIIFNYDRCVEHYLFYAFQNYYGITRQETAKIVKKMNIFHPYGSVGSLPWLENSAPMGFGFEPNPEELLGLANQIKTFAEGTDPKSSEIIAIQDHMAEANKVVFLGFAFHKLNMQIITPTQEKISSRTKCYATTYGISVSDEEVIKDQISSFYSMNQYQKIDRVSMQGSTCREFLNDYWRNLAF